MGERRPAVPASGHVDEASTSACRRMGTPLPHTRHPLPSQPPVVALLHNGMLTCRRTAHEEFSRRGLPKFSVLQCGLAVPTAADAQPTLDDASTSREATLRHRWERLPSLLEEAEALHIVERAAVLPAATDVDAAPCSSCQRPCARLRQGCQRLPNALRGVKALDDAQGLLFVVPPAADVELGKLVRQGPHEVDLDGGRHCDAAPARRQQRAAPSAGEGCTE
mmetsp:Transcript_117906/g.375905  ORF Transcript_117906/g.375905 Transcript_117906/m.375905 type:complete len:222 (-) Transcript_117906:25-690(-)